MRKMVGKQAVGKKVIILGGGVAGMSAAHELIERGFDVAIYERNPVLGGKARSIDVVGSGKDGRKDLPGEHGFRFFPGFYKHVTDTMKRTPASGAWQRSLTGKGKSVYSKLDEVKRVYFDRIGDSPIELPAHFPKHQSDLGILLHQFWLAHHNQLGIKVDDIYFFAERLWQIVTSCERRRRNEYERMSWLKFMEAEGEEQTRSYKQYLVESMTCSLVAAKARDANAKVIGDIAIQMLSGLILPGPGADRILSGPTSAVWIEPWRKFLESKGVKFHLKQRLARFNYANGNIDSVTLVPVDERGIDCGPPYNVGKPGDAFIAALPVEIMARLLDDEHHATLLEDAPRLRGIQELVKLQSTSWMNGLQFYFKEPIGLEGGHVVYLDSPWALTAVSQPQFWPDFKLSELGDGTALDIVSVIISDWDEAGSIVAKPAKLCNREEIFEEVLMQIAHHMLDLPIEHPRVKMCMCELKEKLFACQPFLDPELQPANEAGEPPWQNHSPLFINKPCTFDLQPDAETTIPNLFLASDYVRTFTQLATMEAANEAARRAVNAIIKAMQREARQQAIAAAVLAAGANTQAANQAARAAARAASASEVDIEFCKLWDLNEPWFFKRRRRRDEERYRRGLPWRGEIPWWVPALRAAILWGYGCYLWFARTFSSAQPSSARARSKLGVLLPGDGGQGNSHQHFGPAQQAMHTAAQPGAPQSHSSRLELERELGEGLDRR